MKNFIFVIASIMVTAMALTSCNRGSGSTSSEPQTQEQTQTATATSPDSNAKILNGDLSAFAGTWINSRGERRQLRANGTFNAGETAYGFKIGNENDQHIAGTNYQWIVNMGGEAGGFEVWLYPAGADIRNYYGDFVEADNTKDRIFIESIGSSDDLYYREGELPNPYAKFLAGDLSAFAGTWVNGQGVKARITADGVLHHDIFAGGIRASDFSKTDGANTTYSWWVSQAGDGFGVNLHPAGTEVLDYNGQSIQTDKTKVRITIQSVSRSDEIYYREGELPPVSESVNLILGTWMYESGSFVYFFGQSPSIHFLPDKTVNVYEHGDPYLRLARSGIWGFTPEGQLFVEHNWNTYMFTINSNGEKLIITDSDGDRGVFGIVRG